MHESCATSRPAIALPAGAAHPRGISPSTVKLTRIRFASVYLPQPPSVWPLTRLRKEFRHSPAENQETGFTQLSLPRQRSPNPTPKLSHAVSRSRVFPHKILKNVPLPRPPPLAKKGKPPPLQGKAPLRAFFASEKAPSTATMQSFTPPPPPPIQLTGAPQCLSSGPPRGGWGGGGEGLHSRGARGFFRSKKGA